MPGTTKLKSNELGRHLGQQGPRQSAKPQADSEKCATGNLNIQQLNISGLQYKKDELLKTLQEHKIHIALLQETILPKQAINITGYTQHKCECKKCQGIMTLVHNDIQAEVQIIHNIEEKSTDTQKILCWFNDIKYTIFNIYCPPTSTKELNFQDTTFQKTIVAGDFNAHSPLWGYKSLNKRGKEIEDLCNTSNLILKQNSKTDPTLLHRASGATSRPDLTMVSADISERCTCRVLEDIGSDHKPILITIQVHQKNKEKRKSLWNYKKADWSAYATLTDNLFENINMTDTTENIYTTITKNILEVARATIPNEDGIEVFGIWL